MRLLLQKYRRVGLLSTVLLLATCFSLFAEEKRFTLEVLFTDGKTMQPVSDVEVTITNLRTNNSTTTITGENGSFNIVLRDESIFSITGYKQNYFFSGTQNFSTIGRPSPSTISLDMNIREIMIGENYKIDGVEFGINSFKLTSKSQSILDELIQVMMQNPSLQIEIGCHTDSRGNDEYNIELSQKRADEIINYLIQIGVEEDRLSAKGYGEQSLLNQCSNGVRCSQTAHKTNRRVEFTVLSAHY